MTLSQVAVVISLKTVFTRIPIMRLLKRSTWRLKVNSTKKETQQKSSKKQIRFPLTAPRLQPNKAASLVKIGNSVTINGVMEKTGVTIRRSRAVLQGLGKERNLRRSLIGHQLGRGSQDGRVGSDLPPTEGGHQCQEKVRKKDNWTRKIGGHLMKGMNGTQDLLSQEMRGSLLLQDMRETEGHLFLMNMADDHLSLQMNEAGGLRGGMNVMEDPHTQVMKGTEDLLSQEMNGTDLPFHRMKGADLHFQEMVGMKDHLFQGVEMRIDHHSEMREKQGHLHQRMKGITSCLKQ